MKNVNWVNKRGRPRTSLKVRKIMNCLCSSEQILMDEIIPSPESLATKDYTASVHSSQAGKAGLKPDTGNIEEAESSLRESGCLNYEVTSLLYYMQIVSFPFEGLLVPFSLWACNVKSTFRLSCHS